MSAAVVLAVLAAALLHASWNALIRGGQDKALDTGLIHALGLLVALPVVALTGLPRAEAWPYLVASWVIHIGYYIALAGAYKHGELGLTYPVMRGLAPLLVAAGSASLLGEVPAPQAWAGIVAICLGVITVGLSPSAVAGGHRGKALRYALANAVIIALYTVVDGRGVRASGDPAAYVATLFLADGAPYFALVLWQRRHEAAAVRAYLAQRWKLALLGALASFGAYGIALWAMTRAPVASVAALRETSVLFAALIGSLWLKERFGLQRAAGTALVVAGVITLRLS